ncbi:MAG: hypothetical protein ACOH19_15015 [Rhodoglobus sp.]
MRTPGELPPDLGDVFSVQDAVSRGVTPKRLRTRDLETPVRGARMIPVAAHANRFTQARLDLMRRGRAYAAVAPEGFAFSHVTAARLYRMPLPRRVESINDLDISYLDVHVRRSGVIGHRVKDVVIRVIDGLPVVGPELAWIQLAPLLGVDELVIAGDHLVRRTMPASTLHRIRSAMISHTGARGMKTARAAYDLIRARTDSPKESKLRLLIVYAGLPEPIVNFTVIENGEWVGTPDLAYPELKIAIEYEGDHHRDEATYNDDITRREMFAAAGWTVILITKHQLAHPQHIVSRIRSAILRASR